MKSFYKFNSYCSQCGGSKVFVKAWVDVNTNEWTSDVSDVSEIDDFWCDDCEDHTEVLPLPEIWERFNHVPTNEKEEIEKDFMFFKAGTPKKDVLLWFEARCQNGIQEDLVEQ